MKAKIVTTLIGCFGIDERKRKIIEYIAFPKDPEEIAERMVKSNVGFIEEERKVEAALKEKGFKKIEKGKSDFLNEKLTKLSIEENFVKNQAEFNKLISDINIALTKTKIKEAVGRDKLIIQVSNGIDELDKSINIMVERLREWYGLHFPEMDRAIRSNEKYAEIVSAFGSRKSIEHPDLSHFKERSMGIDINKRDAASLQKFADEITSLYSMREELSEYMDDLLKEVAPNMRDIAGPALASKLMSSAGGLEKLSRMASSTIQLLGAEKALFRHLHGRGKSPKHGIIIIHPLIQRAPKSLSGKLSRIIAAKISIAVKMDFYSKEYKGNELRKELEDKVKEIVDAERKNKKTRKV